MALKLYNTLTRKKEEFKPIQKGIVRMYTCGPTVYNHAHIGNFRSFVFMDILRRYLKYKGFRLKHVMNLTDVDDKTIRDSQKQRKTLKDFTEFYTKEFFRDLETLNIEMPEIIAKATDHIPEMVETVKILLKKGIAYKGDDGSVYFSIKKFPGYGKLAMLEKASLKEAASGRVATDEYDKEHVRDFALWKAWEPSDGDIFWETEIGKGRPGWHIECSVMNKEHLAEQIDIHGGARDLIFPHHENEIAQTESLTGKPFVKYWLHGGLLLIDGQKMSKSLGNYITISDVLKKWNFRIIRMLITSSLYQSELNWSEKNLLQAKQSLARIDEFVQKIKNMERENKEGKENQEKVKTMIKKAKEQFEKAMDDNFNTPKALSVLFKFIKQVNYLLAKNKINNIEAKEILSFLEELDKVFNFIFENKKIEIPDNIENLVEQRKTLRKEKKWEEADKIRQEIEQLGFEIKDTPKGVTIRKK